MKNRIIVYILAAVMLLSASVFAIVGCGTDGEMLDYSVTVLGVDGETPVSGVTVSWQQSGSAKGSAVTGEDGVATAQLGLGTYTITISGLDDGLTYPQVSVGAAMRDVTLPLEVMSVTYTAVVLDKTGAAAKDVTVSWSSGDKVETAVTGEDGKAECELPYGDYNVTVSNLPEGNVFSDAISVTGKQTKAQFELRDGESADYSVTVRSAGGLKFKDAMVLVYNSENVAVYSGKTNADGEISVSLEDGNYTASVPTVQDGYKITQTAQLSTSVRKGEVVLTSSVIEETAPNDKVYKIGDIIHDYKFTTPYEVDGKTVTYSIAELLETKEAVVINNWGTQCSWCVKEMPAMENVYQKMKDKIELLAISNYQGGDLDIVVASYRESNNLSFPMMRDRNSFVTHFDITAFPTTIIIDRYGAIAHIESGAIPEEEIWERLINRYVGDNYVQTFTPGEESEPITTEVSKPDITVTADHYQKIAAAVNKFKADDTTDITWYGETKNDMIWPFVLKTEAGVSPDQEVLCSSNTGKPNSMSALYGTVKMPVGKVFVFDYYADTEENFDTMYWVWDGKIIKQVSGKTNGWQTCYLYSELTEGTHTLSISYRKDQSGNEGKDNVYLRNIRFVDVSDISEPTDMLRAAAYGKLDKESKHFPYYANVKIGEDGYYHVVLSDLQNSKLAGNDPSPMLFVNLLGVTNWNNDYSISSFVSSTDSETGEFRDSETDKLLYDCNLTIDGKTRNYRADLIEYCRIASSSGVENCLPVDKELHDILVAFLANVSGSQSHDKQWLEACYFYSHYGTGDPVGNPIIGLTEKTAVELDGTGTYKADMTFTMAPFPIKKYSFTPDVDGVYKVESLIPEAQSSTAASQIWVYDENTDIDHALVYCGEDYMTREGVNEHNFTVYRYMTAGHKYYFALAFQMAGAGTYDFKVSYVGESTTVLTKASGDFYWQDMDEDGNLLSTVTLANTVEYVKDEDGYYHAINPDGKVGGYIYLDVRYATVVGGGQPISKLVDMYIKDPIDYKTDLFKIFDFSKRLVYYTEDDEITTYGIGDMSEWGDEYKDYSDIMKEYVRQGESNTGDEAGFVRVNDDLVKILSMFIELRNNMMVDNVHEAVLENEWLRFCWYYRPYNAENA